MKMKFYQYEKCESCRKARKWLNHKGFTYESIEIRECPPPVKELKAMLDAHGGRLKKIMNTSSMDYRDPKVKEKLPQMTEKDVLSLLSTRGNLIKRPFLISGNIYLQGFKPDLWEKAFASLLK